MGLSPVRPPVPAGGARTVTSRHLRRARRCAVYRPATTVSCVAVASGDLHRRDAEVGQRIAEARRESRLSQSELAIRIGIPLGLLEKLEAGEADCSPHLEQIAKVTGRPPAWFTERGERPMEGWALLGKLAGDLADLRAKLSMRLDDIEARVKHVELRLGQLDRDQRQRSSPPRETL